MYCKTLQLYSVEYRCITLTPSHPCAAESPLLAAGRASSSGRVALEGEDGVELRATIAGDRRVSRHHREQQAVTVLTPNASSLSAMSPCSSSAAAERSAAKAFAAVSPTAGGGGRAMFWNQALKQHSDSSSSSSETDSCLPQLCRVAVYAA